MYWGGETGVEVGDVQFGLEVRRARDLGGLLDRSVNRDLDLPTVSTQSKTLMISSVEITS